MKEIILIFCIFFLSILTIYFAYKYYSNRPKDETNNDISVYSHNIEVKIKNLKEGEIEDGFCLNTCLADLEVTYDNDTITLTEILFTHSIQGIRPIYYNFKGDNLNYYILRYGSGNECGTYVFNNNGYISKSFCSVDFSTEESILLEDNKLIYNDCGVASNYLEILGGISMIDLDTGDSTQIVKPITGDIERSFSIYSFNKSENLLYIEECTYPTDTYLCQNKIIYLNNINSSGSKTGISSTFKPK